MNKWEFEIRKRAEKFILSQSPRQQDRIFDAIYKLPYEGDIKHMAGEKSYAYRLRVGKYRILFERHDEKLVILVVDAGNRGDIYK